jgi:hypothetical protein
MFGSGPRRQAELQGSGFPGRAREPESFCVGLLGVGVPDPLNCLDQNLQMSFPDDMIKTMLDQVYQQDRDTLASAVKAGLQARFQGGSL